jgi:2-dehydropantoate 2-reductase
VYGMYVMCPATFLEPGVVQVRSVPVSGLLDVGRYPHGVDSTTKAVAAALSASTFESQPLDDVMRWKYNKLLSNLRNTVQIVCGLETGDELHDVVHREGVACLEAAGLTVASSAEARERRGNIVTNQPVRGSEHRGSSTWQSIVRGVGSVETDYLNGEIVLLGRLHGVPTPANELLQRLAADVVTGRTPAGSITEAAILTQLDGSPTA